MDETEPKLLSELIQDASAPQTWRSFLTRGSLRALAIPGVGAALATCSAPSKSGSDTAHPASSGQGGAIGPQPHNSDSRLDSAVLKGEHHAGNSATGTATQGAATEAANGVRASDPPGGGMVFDLVCDVPGEFPFVNHGFGHGQKGAIGILLVEG